MLALVALASLANKIAQNKHHFNVRKIKAQLAIFTAYQARVRRLGKRAKHESYALNVKIGIGQKHFYEIIYHFP